MFGIIRPCRHRLSPKLRESWLAHLCGMCLALRDDHGQLARTVTNYDGLVISALVEGQSTAGASRRKAGPCPLRGMRSAQIVDGSAPRLAAAVSLVLASAKIKDHVVDGDGPFRRRPVAGAARIVATRWARQGSSTGTLIGFDTAVLLDAVERQSDVESEVGSGASVLLATEPTETATAAAFAHTAVLSGRPDNAVALSEAGRLFGRVAHLIDAVEDLSEDGERGAYNPLLATGTTVAEARRLCEDAALGVKLALREVEFTDRDLVHRLLVHELEHAVQHAFGVDHGQAQGHGHGRPSSRRRAGSAQDRRRPRRAGSRGTSRRRGGPRPARTARGGASAAAPSRAAACRCCCAAAARCAAPTRTTTRGPASPRRAGAAAATAPVTVATAVTATAAAATVVATAATAADPWTTSTCLGRCTGATATAG